MTAFEEIAKLVGTRIHRSVEKFDDYDDIPGNGVTMRIRWKFERHCGLLVTFFKTPEEGHRPKEFNLGWFVEFKKGSAEDLKLAASDDVRAKIDLIKKYALGYLTGEEHNFDEIAEYAHRITVERQKPDPKIKPVKWIRAEWIP